MIDYQGPDGRDMIVKYFKDTFGMDVEVCVLFDFPHEYDAPSFIGYKVLLKSETVCGS